MIESTIVPLSFITAPAVLMNGCAIIVNGTNIRYNLAVTQLRDFRVSIAGNDNRIALLYDDAQKAFALAKKRVKVQLIGLNLLYTAVGFFGLTTLLGLLGSFFGTSDNQVVEKFMYIMMITATVGTVTLSLAIVAFTYESFLGRSLVNMHIKSISSDN